MYACACVCVHVFVVRLEIPFIKYQIGTPEKDKTHIYFKDFTPRSLRIFLLETLITFSNFLLQTN